MTRVTMLFSDRLISYIRLLNLLSRSVMVCVSLVPAANRLRQLNATIEQRLVNCLKRRQNRLGSLTLFGNSIIAVWVMGP